MRSPWSAEQDDIILGVPPTRDEGTWDRLAEEDAVAAGLVGSGAGDVSGTQEIVAAGLRATQPDELPLWEEQGIGPSEPGEAADRAGLPDLKAQLREVVEAWREIVPDGSSSADDLRVALEADVQALQVRWQNIAATPAAPVVATAKAKAVTAPAAPGRRAEAVNAALRDADRSHSALRDLAEWREIGAVREAVGRLWRSLTAKAGESVHRLLADRRVSEFLRSASIHACERIAQLAQQGSDFLRGRQGSLPTAEALLALGETASAYSASARCQTSLPTAEALLSSGATLQPVPRSSPPSSAVDVPGLRRMGQALERPGPTAEQTRRVSANAAKARSVGQAPRRSATGVGEQPAHLRRGGASVQPGRTPKQR